jgi:hypothetical protein
MPLLIRLGRTLPLDKGKGIQGLGLSPSALTNLTELRLERRKP